MEMTLGQSQEKTLTLNTHIPSFTFIYSISCLHLPTFRSQAAIVSTVFTFTYRKAKVTKFYLGIKYVKVNLEL